MIPLSPQATAERKLDDESEAHRINNAAVLDLMGDPNHDAARDLAGKLSEMTKRTIMECDEMSEFKHGDAVMEGDIEWVYCSEVPGSKKLSILVDGTTCKPHIAFTRQLALKPRTIMIGDMEVPEPVREPLEKGQVYWMLYSTSRTAGSLVWEGHKNEYEWIADGLIQLTKEGAELQREALLKLCRGE